MPIKYIDEVNLKNQRVLARFDFNVPLDKKDHRKILDTSRIDLAIPTIRFILENGAKKLVLMSHLGRPKGQVVPSMSLEPVAIYLAKVLGQDVVLSEHPVDSGVKRLLTLGETQIVLLENLRFDAGEEANSKEFAEKLAENGDIFINDAFGAAHRKHASVHAIHFYFPKKAYGGFLLKKEIQALSKITQNPQKPFVGVIGGAKISDKIKTIERLLVGVDQLLIGGAMAYPFLKAKNIEIANSLCLEDDIKLAKKILSIDRGSKIILPLDHLAANSPEQTDSIVQPDQNISEGLMGLDIGNKTLELYSQLLAKAKTVFWNGPMGYFENPIFAKGTMEMANIISKLTAFTVVGGGDSVSAVKQSGLSEQFDHISTGGGASLEFIENGDLPGIRALKYGV